MKIKNIIGQCLSRMGLENCVENDNFTSQEQQTIDALVRAINIVYNEITAQYLPLVEQETVTFVDGKLSFSVLEKRILYPIRLEEGGVKCDFTIYPDRIESDCQRGVLKYAYLIDSPLEFDGDIEDMRLDEGTICLGVLAQYYFANKMYDLAKSFDEDFRGRMSAIKIKQKDIRLKQRRWGA